jgi:exopolysaccharide biosynthesis polyprenyl glycosylphosphotransferase
LPLSYALGKNNFEKPMKLSEIILGLLKIPLDFAMSLLAFICAYYLRTNTTLLPDLQPADLEIFPPLNEYITFSTILVTILIILLAVNKAYSLKRIRPLNNEIIKIIMISSAWFMLIIVYFFLIREFPFSRLVLGYSWILTIVFISADRAFIKIIERILLKFNIGKRRILFIGDNDVTIKLAEKLKKNPKYQITGVINDKKNTSLSYLGSINDLNKIVKSKKIQEIIQTKSDLSSTQASEILDYCRENHLEYGFVPDLVSIHQINIEVQTINGIPLISLKPTPLDGWGRVVKRCFDLLGAICGLIVLSPILFMTAIAIKLDSKGTILFKYLDDGSRVKRVGQYGKQFNFYKFRTMYPNTHNLRYTKLAEHNLRKGTPLVKIKNDPRITKVGRLLRKTNIDELPQLINVIKGDMSLVGPRPHLPEEVAKYEQHHKFVLTIKPGITGLAQISGRSDLHFEEEIQLDTYYVEHWSIWMDIKIIFKTIGTLLSGYEE